MSFNERCPFVYGNGHQYCGAVIRARAYGPKRDGRAGVRKYRLWCSEKHDHAGPVPSLVGKDRMEFYPDQLAGAFIERLWATGLVEEP